MGQEKIMNQFLVEIFHEVLRREDAAIASGGFQNLSAREVHVIEAVCEAETRGEGENSSAEIARRLGITAGTLSAAVKVLERKGYLTRRRDERDKRIVRLAATESGWVANRFHEEFHRKSRSPAAADRAPAPPAGSAAGRRWSFRTVPAAVRQSGPSPRGRRRVPWRTFCRCGRLRRR